MNDTSTTHEPGWAPPRPAQWQRQWLFEGLTIANDHLDDEDHRERGTGDHGVVGVTFRWAPAG